MNKSRLLKNEKGMSLVELLVAFAIFAAAIVPMLYAFVYSTGYNFRSQRVQQSTGIAQAIIEKCKGANVNYDDVVFALTNAGDPTSGILAGTQFDLTTGTITTSQPDSSHFWIRNIKAQIPAAESANIDVGNTSRRSYDVLIELKPMPGGLTDHSEIHSMTTNSTANFDDAMCNQLKGFDTVAFGKVIEGIKDKVIPSAACVGGTLPAGYSASDFYDEADIIIDRILIDRNIIITVKDTGVNIKVEYYASYDQLANGNNRSATFDLGNKTVPINGHNYNLTCMGTLEDADGHTDFTYPSGVPFYYAEFDTTPEDGFDFGPTNPVSDVFFFYYPGFLSSYMKSGDPSYCDHFVLENAISAGNSFSDRDGHTDQLNFYIFKQYDDPATGHGYYSNYANGEKNYCPTIEMRDANFNTYLYNNLLWTAKDGTSLAGVAGTYANTWKTADMPVGANCFNMTRTEDHGEDYTVTDYYKLFREFDAPHDPDDAPQFSSYALSDKAVLPYLHAEATQMFGSRYTIEVRVYPHGENDFDSDEIEIMSAELMNW